MESVSIPFVVTNHISVKTAADFSGYSLQYLRRLLRSGKLAGLKIGQVWLIDKSAFEAYLDRAVQATDRRFNPALKQLKTPTVCRQIKKKDNVWWKNDVKSVLDKYSLLVYYICNTLVH